MAKPATTPFQDDLYAALGPLTDQDEALGWPLLYYVGAISAMFDQIETYARDQLDGTPGWAIILQPDRAPDDGSLEWLGNFIGVQLPAGLTTQQKRDLLKGTPAFKRGTPAAMVAAVKRLLTGTQTVFFNERAGDAYHLNVATLASETVDTAAVLSALMTQKPAGIVLAYAAVAGNDYNTLTFTHADYNQVKTRYANYTAVLANPMA